MRVFALKFSTALSITFGILAGVTVLVTAPCAYAQTTSGNVVGLVRDASGAVVPGAAVTVTNEATGVASKTTANSVGQYRVDNVLPGTYDVTSNASGFQLTTLKGVIITLNATATADLTLGVGNATTVEVEANSGVVLDTTSQNLTTTFDNQELSQLPNASIGQGVLNASLLSPGVASAGGLGVGTGPAIAGQRPSANNFMIEGIDNNGLVVTGPQVYVPNDAVGDFTLITTQFSPDFGHSSGGQFNTNVVSGTNKFHGRAYEYFQNRNLNAASGVQGGKVPNPRYDNNRYGGQLGGPIFRDKLFFFGNYERNTVGSAGSSTFICTPTAAGLTALSGIPGVNTNNLANFLKYIPAATTTGAGGAGIDAGNDNACFNQTAGAQYLTVYNAIAQANLENGTNVAGGTATNIPLGNFLVVAPSFSNFDSVTGAIDWTISSKDSFRVRYAYNTLASLDTAATLPVFYQSAPVKTQLLALSEYHNFTPNLTNELRIGYNRYYTTDPSGPFSFPTTSEFPNTTFGDLGSLNLGPDGNAPQSTIQNLYQLTNNVSYTKGKHTIKLGFDGRKYISPQVFVQRERGDYQWYGTTPSTVGTNVSCGGITFSATSQQASQGTCYDGLSQYLYDYAPNNNGFAERSAKTGAFYGDETAFYGYGNDTFRATPKLTLNLGLRYEFTSVPASEKTQGYFSGIASVPGLITFAKPQPDRVAFAPRFGIEYAPNEKTSVRMGFGIAYDVLFDNLGTLTAPITTYDVGAQVPYAQPNFLANGGLTPPAPKPQTTQAAAAALISGYIPDNVLPYSENYTLTIQHELGHGLTAEIGYVGDRGIHLPTQIQINVQPEVTSANVLPTSAGGTTIEAAGPSATTLAAIQASPTKYFIPAYYNNNFRSKITAYEPYSQSDYNGLIANLQGRMKNGLQVNIAYTYSKTMDDATAPTFSTVLTPRRPQNSQNLNADYSRSALDRTHRFTAEGDYNFQAFKGKNWLLRNVVANWVFAPIYTYESPEYATVLSGTNANLNGDSTAISRTIINPSGNKALGSPVTAQKNAAGAIIGYTASNPNAYYIQAASGTLPNASRNTLPLPVENNVDFAAYKRFTAFEHYTLEFGAQAFNALNHAQYIPYSIDNISNGGFTSTTSFQTVTSAAFNNAPKNFSNNARSLQLSGKIIF